MQSFTVLNKKNFLMNLWKILKNVKIHLNYLPFKFTDSNLPNNVYEILSETHVT